MRQFVRTRPGQRCEYCRVPQEFSELRFHIEHIVPRQHGATDDADNLALACPNCNFQKGQNLTAIDPAGREIVSLFHPRRDSWFDHFLYQDAYVMGLTPTGRATTSLLEVNDPERELVAQIDR